MSMTYRRLRDALIAWDSLDMDEGLEPEKTLVETARLVANLDLERAATTYQRQHENGLIDVGDIVDAALGITEDE